MRNCSRTQQPSKVRYGAGFISMAARNSMIGTEQKEERHA